MGPPEKLSQRCSMETMKLYLLALVAAALFPALAVAEGGRYLAVGMLNTNY